MKGRVSEVQGGILIGVISDTHGVVRDAAAEALRGCELIIHAGDVGGPDVLERLRAIAPTIAVRGNNDKGTWANALPATEVIDAGGLYLYVLHELSDLDLDPKAAGFAAVISGHSHRPSASRRDGILYLNPGSAGPRRFTLPVALAKLQIVGGKLSHELIELHA
jgi:putative phosphoesterase